MHRTLLAAAFSLAVTLPSYAEQITVTPAASGGGGGSGTVTNIATSCGVSGGPITTTGTITATLTARNNTTTSDTLVTGDCGTVVTESNASAVAVAIAQAGTTGFLTGYYVTVKNEGAGLVTITPTTSTIDGNASVTVKQNQSLDLYSDGTNYQTLPGRTTNTACADLTNAGTACTAATGTSGATLPFLNGTNTWSGAQTFGNVFGTVSTQSGTTYTLASTDCGTMVRASNASAITYTIPATLPIGCNIAVEQALAGQVTMTGSAVAAATLHSAHSYTKTFGQWAIIGVSIETNSGGSAAVAILTGDGA